CTCPAEIVPTADSVCALSVDAASGANDCGAALTSGLIRPKMACDFSSWVWVASRLGSSEKNACFCAYGKAKTDRAGTIVSPAPTTAVNSRSRQNVQGGA